MAWVRGYLLCMHLKPSVVSTSGTEFFLVEVTIIPLPILGDNYAYLVVDTVSNVAVAVDPSDPAEVKVHISCQDTFS